MSRFSAPRPARAGDDLRALHDEVPDVDAFSQVRLERAHLLRPSRTFVVTDEDSGRVAGYYWLSPHFVGRIPPGDRWAGAPEPIPVVLLGHLAVDRDYRGAGVDIALLRDALRRAIEAAPSISARAVVAHAMTADLAQLFARYGFRPLPSTGGQGAYLPLPLDPSHG